MAQESINIGAAPNDRTGDTWREAMIKSNNNFSELFGASLSSVVIVKTAADLAGTLSSDVAYFIDGVIDMGSQSIEVPAGGITLSGYSFDVSQLVSTASSYTMFVSPVGGSGNIIGSDYAVEVSGSGSKVYDITDATSASAFEFSRINYNNCTSLGTITNYRQGLEFGTGRFGGKPELELSGTWAGGFLIDTSIVRGMTDGAYSLFKAGAGFVMGSRFKVSQNVDLPASVSFIDFSASNFTNPSTLQLVGSIVTRNGVSDASDANITPNVLASELVSSWSGNNGLPNTFVGGELTLTTEVTTTITAAGTYVDLAGTFATADLQHFDSPANGQIRHLGASPREFTLSGQLILDSTANDEVDLKVVIFRAATSNFEDKKIQRRVINNLQGGRDVGYFALIDNIILNQNDYVKLQVANATATNNITAELDSFIIVGAR